MMIHENIILQYSKNNYCYEIFFNGQPDSYYLRLALPNYPSFTDAFMQTSWNLRKTLENVGSLSQWLESFQSISELVESVNQLIANSNNKLKYFSHIFYTKVFDELTYIGQEASLSADFSSVEIFHIDRAGRKHIIKLTLPETYPSNKVIVDNHCLPSIGENFSDLTLKGAYVEFKSLVEIFQLFWDAMEAFDASCWVLEPLRPQPSDVTRRIKIARDCSALLTFNPFTPCHCPTIEFRGCEEVVLNFRDILAKNLVEDLWDPEVDIHLNILSLLDLECFPAKASGWEEEEEALLHVGECGICFEDRLEGKGANQRCDNDKCNSQYHQVCLLKYLSTGTNTVRMMAAIMGKCPTCRETIGCSILPYDE